MAPFRRVVRVAKPIVKARKPQSCALFSSQILRFSSRCPAFCSCVPVLCSSGQPFYFRWSGILPLVARHSASGCPQFYFRCPGLSSHSTFYLPKGSLSPSRFCFSVPNVQYYVTKAHYYHIQANIPCNSRTKTSILCSKCPKTVSVSAITCHQYKESRVCCPAILSSICLGGDLGMLRSLNREAKRLFC